MGFLLYHTPTRAKCCFSTTLASWWGELITLLFLLLTLRIFCPTHTFVTKCNVLQLCPFTLLHTRQKLISRWRISYYCGHVIGHCMDIVLGSLFSLALYLLALWNLNIGHLYDPQWHGMLESLKFHNNIRFCSGIESLNPPFGWFSLYPNPMIHFV